MKLLFFTLYNDQSFIILPDTLAHLDGHIIITETYSVFKDTGHYDQTPQELKNAASIWKLTAIRVT